MLEFGVVFETFPVGVEDTYCIELQCSFLNTVYFNTISEKMYTKADKRLLWFLYVCIS